MDTGAQITESPVKSGVDPLGHLAKRTATKGLNWRRRVCGRSPKTWLRPPCGSLSGSAPVSRILSRAVIHLCDLPEPRRAACKRFGSVLHRVGFTWPPRHRGAGALLPHHFNLACAAGAAIGGVISVALSRGFPRVVSTTTLPCDVRTFLERDEPSRDCPARPRSVDARARQGRARALARRRDCRDILQTRAASQRQTLDVSANAPMRSFHASVCWRGRLPWCNYD